MYYQNKKFNNLNYKMKKLFRNLHLIVLLICINSCDNNDNGSENSDLIVGKWEYSTQYENSTQTTQNDCKPSTIEFMTNGNRNDLYYDENISGDCVVVDDVNATWTKINSSSYQFNYDGAIYTETVTFENNNTKLTLESSDTDGNGNIIVYKFIYNRIN